MRIKNIEIKNFKFHHNLNFDINEQNCLIYGENGSGKSSIYWALYSNFYYLKDKDILNNKVDIREIFKNRNNVSESLEVNIELNENSSLNRKDNNLDNSELLKNKTIYFANEKVLNKITELDFYNLIEVELIKHFPQFIGLLSIYDKLKRELKRVSNNDENVKDELIQKKIVSDIAFKTTCNNLFPITEINTIIRESFDEKFEIKFLIEDSFIDEYNKFINPKVSIKIVNIDNKEDLHNHLNEAKLKLISIAIYFSLAKKFENSDSDLKLIVLDDFLTSLDMGNRKLIIQYILENFQSYQKIILTHNIQFYNLIIKLLNMRNENIEWDIKNIFSRENRNIEESIICDKDENYLKVAREKFLNNELQISGNFLRKEFERIISEFKQILELGKSEKLNNVIQALKSENQNFFELPHKVLKDINDFLSIFERIFQNQQQPDSVKINQIKREIQKIKNIIESSKCDITDIKSVLDKTEFYQSIFMHPSSHDDMDIEIYKKECYGSIKLLEKLNELLNQLKK